MALTISASKTSVAARRGLLPYFESAANLGADSKRQDDHIIDPLVGIFSGGRDETGASPTNFQTRLCCCHDRIPRKRAMKSGTVTLASRETRDRKCLSRNRWR